MIGGYDKNGRPRDGRGVSYTYEGGAPLGYCPDDEPPKPSNGDEIPTPLALLAVGAAIIYGWSYFPIQIKWVIILFFLFIFRRKVLGLIRFFLSALFSAFGNTNSSKSPVRKKRKKRKVIVAGTYDENGKVIEKWI